MNNVSIYKIDNHLILTGNSLIIKEELKKTYNAKWQPAPFNIWVIPNTKIKTFMKNKNITSKVNVIVNRCKEVEDKQKLETKKEIIDKPTKNKVEIKKKIITKPSKIEVKKVIEIKPELSIIEKEITNNLMSILPVDITQEIIRNLDDESITSLLSSSKQFSTLSKFYKDPIVRQALKRELKHINESYIKHYASKILDLKTNDRVTYNYKNYKILTVNGKKGGKMVHVDMLGNVIGDTVNYSIIKEEKDWGAKKIITFHWGIPLGNGKPYSDWTIKNFYLSPGILIFDNGPHINDVNSKYFNHIIVPSNQPSIEPDLNVMVTVNYYYPYCCSYIKEYVITKLEPYDVELTAVDNTFEKDITQGYMPVIKINKLIQSKEDLLNYVYETNFYKLTIKKIGGYGQYRVDMSPR
jgi:hypothetical protein